MDALLDQIARGQFEPIYVLASDHPILIERVVSALREAVVPPAARGFNYDVLEGKVTGTRIVSLAQTLPMMAARRLVYVRELGTMPAEEAEPLLAYLAKPNPSTVILAVTSKLDKRVKLYSTLNRKGYLHVLEAPKRLDGWVRGEAQRLGVKLEPAAASRLLDVVGGDLSRIALAIEQLGLFVSSGGANQAVSSDDVDELIADTRERSVFELTDAIGSGDRGRALAAVASLCDQRESAVGVVVMLARHVRQMAMVHSLRAAGASRSEYPGKLGVPPFIVDKVVAQARIYSPSVLAKATRVLAAADRALKGDITLSTAAGDPFTGPQMKALGRELGERVILENVVDGIVELASR